jgi:eukaryotic-like serine/threonine-protein kinase
VRLQTGDRIDNFEVIRLLGAGGMGEVYLAADVRLSRQVALKILPSHLSQNTDKLRRFAQEARATSALNHPNILTVYDIGEENGTHFIAAEFVAGETLRDKIRGERLSINEALEIAVQAASALSAAHEAGIIHRDIKPENIMLRRDKLVKVLDFGLAKLVETSPEKIDSQAETRAHVKTAEGVVVGTVQYMSPEQARGKVVDARTDVWSLGCVLYEMVAGRITFGGDSTADCFAAIINKQPLPLSHCAENVPARLEEIVAKCLEKDPDERYQTAKDLLIDLRRLKKRLEFEAEIERTPPPENSVTESNETKTKSTVAEETAQITQTIFSAESAARGVKRGLPVVTASLIILLAVVGFSFWYFSNRNTSTEAQQINSIAVLPFENAIGDAGLDYLSDGVSESVIDRLSGLPQLKVIARSSSFRYRGQNLDLPKIADALGVDAIVTGRVLQRDGNYLIRVDVIDVRENKQFWGENFTRKASDVQTLQTDISREIAENLRLKLSGTQNEQLAKQRTNNPQAYEVLLRGRFYFNKGRAENFNKAVEFYEQAVALDPNYALAYAELAEGYNLNGGRGLDFKQILVKQEAAARRALELDAGLAEAHYAMAEVKRKQWNWREAERGYLRAIELNPNLPRAYRGYAMYLTAMKRHDEAIANARRARELDPLSFPININLGIRLYSARRFDEAIAAWQKNVELAPETPSSYFWLGNAYMAKGMNEQAIAEFRELLRKGYGRVATEALIGIVYARTGERARAEEILEKFKTTPLEAVPPNLAVYNERNAALLYDALGRRDEAIAELEKAYAERNPNLPFISFDPAFDSLSSDPRFQDLVRRMNLPQ